MEQIFFVSGCLLNIITLCIYFLSKRNRLVLILLPTLFYLTLLVLNINVDIFAAEEGNILYMIALSSLFSLLMDAWWKREGKRYPAIGLSIIANLLLLVIAVAGIVYFPKN